MQIPIRPRRNRKSAGIRDLVRETIITPQDFIYPLFVHEGTENEPIAALPGCHRWCLKGLVKEAQEAYDLGVRGVVLFPVVPEGKKCPEASESYNPDGIIPQAIAALKDSVAGLTVISDVALDPYNSDGHDGIVEWRVDGAMEILNDETLEILCKQALCHADMGIDIVAPSDMMDGRVAVIRAMLDAEALDDVSIMAYTAKYASAFYGPFRGALESSPKTGDKKTYQMDPGNIREALREASLDEAEGADILMVKPALAYLDVLASIRQASALPLAAYQVSGEYLMLKAAVASGWIDEQAAVLETLTSIKRAGADMILTYYAKQAALWLQRGK